MNYDTPDTPDTLHIILFGALLIMSLIAIKCGQGANNEHHDNVILRSDLSYSYAKYDSLDSARSAQFKKILFNDSMRIVKHRR